ncbi:MAG: acetate uptake transporter [Candidatus Margulisbacteria bacterium]|nr:acetate uptake transporter [Candidatus Margulisiibacteriota bacterium]
MPAINKKLTESAGAIIDNIANPSPLGLFGFGMTTILLNVHNVGLLGFDSMIMAMGICYGGIAQVIAGIFEFKKKNTFGATAFTSYGFFWLSLVVLIILPKLGLGAMATDQALAMYLFLWGVFTTGMFAATMRSAMELRWIFATLAILFFMLSFADFTGIAVVKTFAGIEGIVCGSLSVYYGFKQIYLETYK